MHSFMILLAAPATSFLNWCPPLVPPLYLGPETIMPLASILAAIIGFLLIFWRLIVKFLKKAFKFLVRRRVEPATSDPLATEAESHTEERIL